MEGYNTCWWAQTYEERVEYYRTVCDEDLIKIAEHGFFLDDIPPVICELAKRGNSRTFELVASIVDKQKGDTFLQAWAAEFIKEASTIKCSA